MKDNFFELVEFEIERSPLEVKISLSLFPVFLDSEFLVSLFDFFPCLIFSGDLLTETFSGSSLFCFACFAVTDFITLRRLSWMGAKESAF